MTTAPDAYQSTELPASGSELGLVYPRPAFAEHWTVPEGPVPEPD